ncbi:unnamed protein product [Closterium sp. NIES-53]
MAQPLALCRPSPFWGAPSSQSPSLSARCARVPRGAGVSRLSAMRAPSAVAARRCVVVTVAPRERAPAPPCSTNHSSLPSRTPASAGAGAVDAGAEALEIEAAVAVLAEAARSKQVKGEAVFAALRRLETRKVGAEESKAWLAALGGAASPGHMWQLVFTAGSGEVSVRGGGCVRGWWRHGVLQPHQFPHAMCHMPSLPLLMPCAPPCAPSVPSAPGAGAQGGQGRGGHRVILPHPCHPTLRCDTAPHTPSPSLPITRLSPCTPPISLHLLPPLKLHVPSTIPATPSPFPPFLSSLSPPLPSSPLPSPLLPLSSLPPLFPAPILFSPLSPHQAMEIENGVFLGPVGYVTFQGTPPPSHIFLSFPIPSIPLPSSLSPPGDGDRERGVPGSGGLPHLSGPHGLHCSPPRLHLPHTHPQARPAAALPGQPAALPALPLPPAHLPLSLLPPLSASCTPSSLACLLPVLSTRLKSHPLHLPNPPIPLLHTRHPVGTWQWGIGKEEDKGRVPGEGKAGSKDPFFTWFYVDDRIAAARGRGGGAAFWVRYTGPYKQ